MHGSWVLVRTRRGSEEKPQWLLIKHRDEFAKPGTDIVARRDDIRHDGSHDGGDRGEQEKARVALQPRAQVSAAGSKTENRKAESFPRCIVPQKNRGAIRVRARGIGQGARRRRTRSDARLRRQRHSFEARDWTFEPKYDGIRVLAYATPESAHLVTRNGKDKTAQFPGIAEAVRKLAARGKRALVLDGEVVALEHGAPARFQELQQRMHVKDASAIAGFENSAPVALMAFDLLLDGDDVLVHEPWTTRRARLEKRLGKHIIARAPTHGFGRSMTDARCSPVREPMVGKAIIAKRIDAPYQPGVRSRDWLKLKLEFRQEFVVGGFTEPRNTRQHIGALLLGYYDRGRFIYAGNMGGGFDNAGLAGDVRAARAARAKDLALRGDAAPARARALGDAASRGRGEVQRVDHRRKAAPADLRRHAR